jgi:hypothetical protein
MTNLLTYASSQVIIYIQLRLGCIIVLMSLLHETPCAPCTLSDENVVDVREYVVSREHYLAVSYSPAHSYLERFCCSSTKCVLYTLLYDVV